MTRAERIEELLAQVEPVLEALRDEAMREITAAKHEAEANAARHDEAARELAEVEAEASALIAEREELPNRAYRAGLDGDEELEARLSERYRNLRLALEALEDRRGSLKDEMRRLNPRGTGHPTDATAYNLGLASGVAYRRREELEDLRRRLTKALDAATDPVVDEHKNLRATVEQLGRDRAWALSPVGKGGLRI